MACSELGGWSGVATTLTRGESDSRRSRWRWLRRLVALDPDCPAGGGHTSVGVPRGRSVRRPPLIGPPAGVRGWLSLRGRTSRRRPGGPQSGRVGTESRATGRTGRGIELGSVYAPPDAARFRPPCSLRSPCRLTVPQASHGKNTLVWCHGCALVLSWPTARVSVVNRSELARTFVFGHLDLVHVSFYTSRTPALGQPGVDGGPIVLQVAAEAAQFRRTGAVHIGHPVIQLATAPFTNKTQEVLRQLTRTHQFRAALIRLLQEYLLFFIQIRRSSQQQPGEGARAGQHRMGRRGRLGDAPACQLTSDGALPATIAR